MKIRIKKYLHSIEKVSLVLMFAYPLLYILLLIAERIFHLGMDNVIYNSGWILIIASGIYILCRVVREREKKMENDAGSEKIMKCKSCGEEIREGSSFCGKCGTKINELNELRQNVENEVSLSNACQNCGAKLADGANFCSKCGAICGEALRDKKKMMWWKIAIAAFVIVSLVFIFVSINSAQPKNAIIGTWESDSDSISFSENGKFTQGVYYGTYTIYSDSTLELTYQDWDRFGSNRTYRFGLEAMNPGDDAYSYWYISDGYLYLINEVYTKQ